MYIIWPSLQTPLSSVAEPLAWCCILFCSVPQITIRSLSLLWIMCFSFHRRKISHVFSIPPKSSTFLLLLIILAISLAPQIFLSNPSSLPPPPQSFSFHPIWARRMLFPWSYPIFFATSPLWVVGILFCPYIEFLHSRKSRSASVFQTHLVKDPASFPPFILLSSNGLILTQDLTRKSSLLPMRRSPVSTFVLCPH